MSDVIQLLPESVANQIAAGEVVQRPASAVKELVENAIDAGATHVKLVVKDAGKTLIQVIDNGCGMSPTDARMSFERHATSKIKKSDDLFQIMTKGFRGEALASIAAIAQVELRTRQRGQELGTLIEIEGSKVKSQTPVQCAEGSNFSIKNLFFNVPARRYFLKSDAIELRHIIDEMHRVALTHEDVEFSFTHNGAEVFNLPRTTLRQRIVHVFGNKYNEKLVPVEEQTDLVKVTGFVGKPESARKTRGEQFFFVNQRYIKNQYLHHAVMTAFEQMVPQGHFPLYLLYLEIDPEQIDINIHPTKTEIKFQDERAIYAILHAAVRRALGKFSIAPSLDFEQEQSIPITPLPADAQVKAPVVKVNPEYNPFGAPKEKSNAISGWFKERESRAQGWEDLLQVTRMVTSRQQEAEMVRSLPELDVEEELHPVQVQRRFIVCETTEGMLLIDQQRAHQRVLFERFKSAVEQGKAASQQLLFPEEIELPAADAAILASVAADMSALGFVVEQNGGGRFTIHGVPADTHQQDYGRLLEELLDKVKEELDLQLHTSEKVAWALARSASIQYGQMLTEPEMVELVRGLFQCQMPTVAWKQKKTMVTLRTDQLTQLLA